MRHGLFLALLALTVGSAGAQAAPPVPQTLVLPRGGEQKTYNFGALSLQIVMPDPKRKGEIALTVSSPGAVPATLNLPHDPQEHELAPVVRLAEMDASNATPEILVSRHSGGAHCCTMVDILDLSAGKWIVIEAGHWNGDDVALDDADHDNELEMIHGDDRFLYLFSCYACDDSPARIFKLVDGALTDITASPLLRARDESALPDFRRGCGRHDNEACAAYVAVMTRLGRHDEGWQFMLRNYDRKQDMSLTDCAQRDAAGNCTAQIKYQDYPDALESLIRRTNEWQPGAP